MSIRLATASVLILVLLALMLSYLSTRAVPQGRLPVSEPKVYDEATPPNPREIEPTPFERPSPPPVAETLKVPSLREAYTIEQFRDVGAALIDEPGEPGEAWRRQLMDLAPRDQAEARRLLEVLILGQRAPATIAALLLGPDGLPPKGLLSEFLRLADDDQIARVTEQDAALLMPYITVERLRSLPPLVAPPSGTEVSTSTLYRLAASGSSRAITAIEQALIANISQKLLPKDARLSRTETLTLGAALPLESRLRVFAGVEALDPKVSHRRELLRALSYPLSHEDSAALLERFVTLGATHRSLARPAIDAWLATERGRKNGRERIVSLCMSFSHLAVMKCLERQPIEDRVVWINHLVLGAKEPLPDSARIALAELISLTIRERFTTRASASDFRIRDVSALLDEVELSPYGLARDALDVALHAAFLGLLRSLNGDSREEIGDLLADISLADLEALLDKDPELLRASKRLLGALNLFTPFDAEAIRVRLLGQSLSGIESERETVLLLERLAAESPAQRRDLHDVLLRLVGGHESDEVRGRALALALSGATTSEHIEAAIAATRARPDDGLSEALGRELPRALRRRVLTPEELGSLIASELEGQSHENLRTFLNEFEDSLNLPSQDGTQRDAVLRVLQDTTANAPLPSRSKKALDRLLSKLTVRNTPPR